MSQRHVDGVCPVCDKGPLRFRFEAEIAGFEVVECAACGLAITWPPVPEEELTRYYPPTYYGKNNRRFHPLLEKLVLLFRVRRARRVHRMMPKGAALDVGCGRGHFLAYLQRKGWRVLGVELSEVAAKHAREVNGVEVVVDDFLKIPLTPGTFDVIIIWHVLEHLPRPEAVLAKAREVLADGGVLLVAVPNFSSLQAAVAGRRWFHLDIPRHCYHFKSRVLLELLDRHGFDATRVSHFSVEQNIYGWLQSLYNLLGFRFNLLYNLLKRRGARDIPTPFRSFPFQCVGVLLLLPVLLALSLVFFLIEVLVRRGGTVEVYARKRPQAAAGSSSAPGAAPLG